MSTKFPAVSHVLNVQYAYSQVVRPHCIKPPFEKQRFNR